MWNPTMPFPTEYVLMNIENFQMRHCMKYLKGHQNYQKWIIKYQKNLFYQVNFES